MSDDNQLYDLTRRKVLGSLGALGVGAALGGAGTAAFFSDEETFENNRLVAGELDLKVDWQQTYNGPNPGNNWAVETHPVNAYPDSNGDGVQDLDGVPYSGAGEVAEPVFDAADIPACCDCGDDEYYLTYGGETFCIEPLSIDQDADVGTFYDYEDGGAGTFSSLNDDIQREDTTFVFLYENGGNVSLVFVNDDRENADGGSAASFTIDGAPKDANPLGDWQLKDDSEEEGPDEYGTYNADWVWAENKTDGGALGSLDDDFAMQISGALNDAAALSGNSIRGDGQITELAVLSGGSGLGSSEEIVLETGIGESENNEVGPITIHSSCGIESGADLPDTVFESSYYPGQEHLIELDDVKPGDKGEITFSLHLCDNPGYVWLKAMNFDQGGGALTEPERVAINESDANISNASSVGESDDPGMLAEYVDVTVWYDEDCDNAYDEEEVEIFSGTLAEMMAALGVGEGAEDEGMLPLDPMPESDDHTCFPGEEGFCLGFEWEVSEDVGNIIQGDWVEFDLGFYTEQCRHNEGAGSLVTSFVTTQAFSGADSQNCDHSDPISLPYGDLGSEQVLTVDASDDPVVFTIDLAKELVGGQYPDNFGLAFETDGDGLGDFQVGYTAGTGWEYEEPVATGMSPGLPSGIQGSADGAGQYTIEIDRSLLGSTFSVGGKAGYASETPPSGGNGNVVVNFTPEFCFGPGGWADASTYQEIDL